ncbi:glycosyltransferase family 4 protein [Flavobacterium sp. UMI-01]|uniref:glycosyltransferase family 4 protein n=1 Tax=Flavobacterium sp. UMI-01 TaxID=1441053 RepID=UPI001C7D25BB|nr:glycosyltransferase [Flavobacterium sp. UMI-01]GIZ07484.1 glycosyl transferase [Flavobacterium sp. UMI-01]
MKLGIITHVPHCLLQKQYMAYAPYVREMNLWLKYVDEVEIVAPLAKVSDQVIDVAYEHRNLWFSKIPSIQFTSAKSSLLSLYKLPIIIYKIYKACKKADHIHLRCPGNIGLLGCLVQIFFPHKPKTAKYAGNWDPKAKQPWSYRFQKWILNNPFLTRNIQVLVYGQWEKQSKNIVPFFTATYSQSEILPLEKKRLDTTINFIFVGTLSVGKNPLYAIQLVEKLYQKGFDVQLHLCGEGNQRTILEDYIKQQRLQNCVQLTGNLSKEQLKNKYLQSHFVILASASEGWPKAIAEGMFWGCVPLASPVSCVPDMIGNGSRGIVLNGDIVVDLIEILKIMKNESQYQKMSMKSLKWSQHFTTTKFESEIKGIIKKNN